MYGGGGGGTYYGGGPYWDDYWGGCYYFGGQYYYWGGYYYSPFRGAYGRVLAEPDYVTRTYTHRADPGRRLPIFFPPDPPPLGSPTPPPPPQRPYLTAPIELADYVAEPFYAPLSTRLAKGNLTNALRTRLDADLANKRTLEAALRSRLATLASVDPSTRLRELTAFAQQQTPRIAAAEREAEQLRRDLLRPGLVGALWGSGDWNEHRKWHLGSGRLSGAREHTLALEFQVVRAAAFYQDGLSPAQRRLLRELAMELQVQAYAPAGATSAANDDGLVYFSPETARVRFPTNISADLPGKIASYTKQKSGLKDELRDAIYRLDSATPAHRTAELRRLASAQAPRVAALEEAAEDIRRELAATHGADSIMTALPPELAARLLAWHHQWRTIEQALAAKLADINRSYGFEAVSFVRSPDPLASTITLHTQLRPTAASEQIKYRVQATVAAFNRESAELAANVKKEAEALRHEVETYASAHPDVLAGKSADQWWKSTMESLAQQEVPSDYNDYKAAVLEPGLSPEQRRLLFAAALRDLRLPLPGGELQP